MSGGGLPTLLTIGAIAEEKWMTDQDKTVIRTEPSVMFLMRWLADRIPEHRATMPKITPRMPGDKILLLNSGTGSGKSTTIPPKIFELFYTRVKKTIGVTQPRVVNAIDIPRQIAMFNSFLKMEENIGYQTGDFKKTPSNGILFMTVGILLQHFMTLTDEQIMNKYMVVIIDECHIRELINDILFNMIKSFLNRNYNNPDCPFFIFMSATFDDVVFTNYFKIPDNNFIKVHGQTFPITEYWPSDDSDDIIKDCVDIVRNIHINIGKQDDKASGDIIIFVPGQGITNMIAYELHKLNLTLDEHIAVVEVSRTTVQKRGRDFKYITCPIEEVTEQLLDFSVKGGGNENIEELARQSNPLPVFNIGENEYKDMQGVGSITVDNNISFDNSNIDIETTIGGFNIKTAKWQETPVRATRRVYIATNVVETGVTIDSLKYCIDTGLQNQVIFNPVLNYKMISLAGVTQGMAIQRRGRAGRKQPGVWYPLYSKSTFAQLIKDQYPEILTADISNMILALYIKRLGVSYDILSKEHKMDSKFGLNLLSLDLMTDPPVDSITTAIEKLVMLGFLQQLKPVKLGGGSFAPTKLGCLVRAFKRVRLESILMILTGFYENAHVLDLITLAIMLEYPWNSIYMVRKGRKYKSCNPLGLDPETADLYFKLLWADEFMELIFIWNMFMDKLNSVKFGNGGLYEVKEWCDGRKFNFQGLLTISKDRDELIESLLGNGINVFYNSRGLPPGKFNLYDILRNNIEEGMHEVLKIQKCIKWGYQMHMAALDATKRAYTTLNSELQLQLESSLINDKSGKPPIQILIADTIIKPNPFNPQFSIITTDGPLRVIL